MSKKFLAVFFVVISGSTGVGAEQLRSGEDNCSRVALSAQEKRYGSVAQRNLKNSQSNFQLAQSNREPSSCCNAQVKTCCG